MKTAMSRNGAEAHLAKGDVYAPRRLDQSGRHIDPSSCDMVQIVDVREADDPAGDVVYVRHLMDGDERDSNVAPVAFDRPWNVFLNEWLLIAEADSWDSVADLRQSLANSRYFG